MFVMKSSRQLLLLSIALVCVIHTYGSSSNAPSLSVLTTSYPSHVHHTTKDMPPNNDLAMQMMLNETEEAGTAPENEESLFSSFSVYNVNGTVSIDDMNVNGIYPSIQPSSKDNETPKWKRRPSSTPTTLNAYVESPSTKPSREYKKPLPPSYYTSNSPTEIPTGTQKIKHPTNAPTTAVPTFNPSYSPSFVLSQVPTSSPTLTPSSIPTIEPSNSPSIAPTTIPTISNYPSSVPSPRPTGSPTRSAPPTTSNFPTNSPSLSSIPSLSQKSESRIMSLSILGFDKSSLDVDDKLIWEEVTSTFIASYLENILNQVTVFIRLTNQYYDFQQTRSTHNHHAKTLVLQSEVTLFFRSNKDFDISDLIEDAFRTENSRYNYKLDLGEANPRSFAFIENISVQVSSEDDSVLGNPTTDYQAMSPKDDESRSSLSTIILIISGSGVVLLGLITLGYRMVKNDAHSENGKITDEHSSRPEQNISTMIEIEAYDDVSELGDPTLGEHDEIVTKVLDSQSLFSVGLIDEYDDDILDLEKNFSRVYGEGTVVGTPTYASIDASLNTDASSSKTNQCYKNIFTVHAPQGKLGIIIDSPNNCKPIIHAIKDISPLFDVLNVGDEIISFNDIDTTKMGAVELTRLISSSYDSDKRELVLSRKKNST